jgi:heme o synthase
MTEGVHVQGPLQEGRHLGSVWGIGRDEFAASVGVLRSFVDLTKPRIALLIVISTAVGYCYGTVGSFNITILIYALLGAALMAGGSAALNQWYERDLDSQMARTRLRPIPAGDVSATKALLFGLVLSVAGFAELWHFTNSMAALLGAGTWVGYLLFYTPLKRIHPICTSIGAIPGAMPPLIGFAAAMGHLTIEAWVLFGILFLWQFPHFHAIAWIYREDYARVGIRMLAAVRPLGVGLSIEILGALLLLVPISLAPAVLHMTGTIYLFASVLLNVVFFKFGIDLAMVRTVRNARRLLLASVIYLPLLFAALVFDNPRFYS